jgi:hypothetical protein
MAWLKAGLSLESRDGKFESIALRSHMSANSGRTESNHAGGTHLASHPSKYGINTWVWLSEFAQDIKERK